MPGTPLSLPEREEIAVALIEDRTTPFAPLAQFVSRGSPALAPRRIAAPSIRALSRALCKTAQMSRSHADELLSTTQAAQLVQRAQGTVRAAIVRGKLPAIKNRSDATWRVRRDELLAWDKQTSRCTANRPHPWELVVELLEAFGSASSAELAPLLGIDPGNVRKHLAILATQGRARRRPDGQWVLIGPADQSQEVTSKAS